MYKVVMYALFAIVVASFGESYLGLLQYNLQSLGISLVVTFFICIATNFLFAKALRLPFQYESSVITALILFLILLPIENFPTAFGVVVASVLAIASKYILVKRNTHLFNPAAFGIFAVTFVGYFFSDFATAFWWVGSLYLLPVVLITGFLVIRKTRRTAMAVGATLASVISVIVATNFYSMNYIDVLYSTFVAGPIFFFIAFMLTEPHTIAKNKWQQVFYGMFIVLLPMPFAMMNVFHMAPELALLVGNVLSFVISNRRRYILTLKEIKKLNNDTFEYVFSDSEGKNFNFQAGEYMEWDLNHKNADSRGMRRYFTISSTPNIGEVAFATKFPPADESTFKKTLREMKVGDTMYATQLSGDFLLPQKKNKNIIMIAGGIGITPFISQIRELLKENKIRKNDLSIALFYCVKSVNDIVFKDLLDTATNELGLKVVYVVSENTPDPSLNKEGLSGANQFVETGYMTKEILNKYTQNLHNEYYISGPNMMVDMLKKILLESKNTIKHIHTDYFPGF